jgi:hypothetical protein
MPAVPEIAVTEDGEAMSDDYQIRSARQRGRMQSKSNSSSPQGSSQEDLGSGILTTIAGPNPAGRWVTRAKALVPRHRPFSLLGWHSLNVGDSRPRPAF